MKKAAFVFLAAGLVSAGISASAAIGDVVGQVYSTDILATVNGAPIPSYSLDGKTAIALRDLENYGFLVAYTDDARVSIAEFSVSRLLTPIEGVERGTVGEVVGDVLETDIVAYVNGEYVPTYNIGGRLVAAIEDIAPWNDGSEFAPYGYAKTGMTYTWDENGRTIDLITLPIESDSEAWAKAREYSRHLRFDGTELFVEENKLDWAVLDYTYATGDRLSSEAIQPITYTRNDGGKEEIGLYYSFKRVTWDIGAPVVNVSPEREMTYISLNTERLEEIFADEEPYKRSFDEEVDFYCGGRSGVYRWRLLERIDGEDCTLLLIRNMGLMNTSDPEYRLVRIDREPAGAEVILKEQIAAPELYGDELCYFKGTSIYSMNIYDKTELEIASAEYRNILAYIANHKTVLYEHQNGNKALIIASDGENTTIYTMDGYGIDIPVNCKLSMIYVSGDEAAISDGMIRYYVTVDGIVEDEAEVERICAEGERLL